MRDQGYAVAVDELEVGLTAVAAPIRNAHGDVIASISVSGPTFRLTQERIDEVVPRSSTPRPRCPTASAGAIAEPTRPGSTESTSESLTLAAAAAFSDARSCCA